MKALPRFCLPVLLSVFLATDLQAQISFERNYSQSVYYTELSEGEEKLFLMDVTFSECRIYNLDHSLYKTIKITLDPDYYLYDINHVSRSLFNDDNPIELLYMAYRYFEGTDPYYKYVVGVVDETGTDLLKVDEGTFYEIIEVAGQNKLLVWLYDNSTWPYFKGTNIYKLEAGSTRKASIKSATTYDPAYPNPTANHITLPYKLPQNTRQATISIFRSSGGMIGEYIVDFAFNELYLDVSDYSAGVYHYTVVSENVEVIQSGKFTVAK